MNRRLQVFQRIRSLAILVSLAVLAPAFAGSWTESFDFNTNAVEVRPFSRDGRSFDLVIAGNSPALSRRGLTQLYTIEPGHPLLPCWEFTLVIPQGMRLARVEVEPGAVQTLPGTYSVLPAQQPVPVSVRELPALVEPDPAVYSSDAAWPGIWAKHGPTGTKSGWRLGSVTLYPVQYRPADGRLELATDLRVRVVWEADPTAPRERLTPEQTRDFRRGVAALVINQGDVDRYAPPVRSTDWGNVDCVIITDTTLVSSFAPLAAWHTRKGYKTEVRTTQSIYSSYSGRDNPERIRSFIINYYNNQGLRWVLLAGDNSLVPARQARTYCAGETGNIPCDLYYGDIQWSWDGDNDNIFGEAGQDTVDLYYDLYVGRASVDNATQASTFVNKVLTHDRNPPLDYLKRMLLVDAPLWTGYDETQSNDSVGAMTPSGWTDRYIHSPGNVSMVRDSLNHGFQFCHLVGHGNDIGIYNGAMAYYSNSVISGHTNGSRVGLINSIACYSGNYEYNDCLAENTHNCATGGALNVIFNSRYGWGTPPVIGPSEKLDIRFYDFFFNRESLPIGVTHATSKEVYRNYSTSDGAWRWCYFELNLFGDPVQLMYENVPTSLSALFSSPIPTGSQNFTVTVQAGASAVAVAGALVCVMKGTEVYARNYTNSSGQVTFSIAPSSAGWMSVTATAPDHLPAEDSCQVIAANQDVGCTRIIAPTGTIDAGSAVTPRAMVRNYGTTAVSVVPVMFRIGSAYTGYDTIATIPAGDSAQATFPVWIATAGTHATACTTRLPGDINRNNDKATGSVTVLTHDVGTVSVGSPPQVDSGDVVSLSAVVRNYGSTSETFSVWLRVSGTGYNQNRSKTLAAGAQDTVNFPAWTALARGTHVVSCTTLLTGDANPANDRATVSTFVRVIDVGVSSINSPAGGVDSAATVPVQATIRNHGNVTVSFPAVFRITGQVSWTDHVDVSNLAAGGVTTVSFDPWPCGPRGAYTTACTTRLDTDMATANDRQTGSFAVNVHDAAAAAIISPGAAADSGTTVPVRVAVTNKGSLTEELVVAARFGSDYVEQVLATVYAGATDTVQLTPWTVGLSRGFWPAACSTWVAGDADPTNDVLERPLLVNVRDAAVTALVAPSGRVDSGAVITPQALISNAGNVDATFNVRFTIADGYSSTRTVTLAGGRDSVVGFASWTARIPGRLATRCTTLLAGDAYPANDYADSAVTVVGTDVGVIAIDAPAAIENPGPVDPACRVQNYSPVARTFWTWIEIGNSDGAVYRDSAVVTNLGPDSVASVGFATWNATSGLWIARCSTGLGPDRNPSNDTLSAACRVVRPDVGVVSIVVPTGTMRMVPVAPLLRVTNFGDQTASFPVHLSITDQVSGEVVYADSATVPDLPPGSTRDQRLPEWASRVGSFDLVAWSAWPPDCQPVNDTAFGSVLVTHGVLGWSARLDMPPGGSGRPARHGACLAGLPSDPPRIFALKGYKTYEFFSYDPVADAWDQLADLPPGPSGKPVKKSSAICSDGERYLYCIKGNRTYEFWRYDAESGTWDQLADVPGGKLKYGTGLAYVRGADSISGWIYCLKASKTLEFYRFDVGTGTWHQLANAPLEPSGRDFRKGSAITVHDDGTLYVLKGKYNDFYRYSVAKDSWAALTPMPGTGHDGRRSRPKDGADLAADGQSLVYAMPGGNRDYFFCYNIASNGWTELDPVPMGNSGRRVKHGGSLFHLGRQIWALKGNKTAEFYAYTPDTMVFAGGERPQRDGVSGGRAAAPVRFELRPNPAVGRVAWLQNRSDAGALIRLYSPLGQLLAEQHVLPGRAVRFGLDRLAAGNYFVRIITPDAAETRKLVLIEPQPGGRLAD